MKLSKRVRRQVENLSKTFEFDMDRRVAIIPLYYDTPEELIDVHLSTPGKPIVSDDAVDYLCEVVSFIPKEFTVEIKLIIDDYGEYSHETLMNALRATIEDTYYYYDENRKKDNVLAMVFLILGILFLALETIGGMTGWYGESGSVCNTIIETVIDILVWVFAWEGAALLLLTYRNDSTQFYKAMERFSGISFWDKEGNALSCLEQEEFYNGWIYLEGREVLSRNYILFSNTALLAILSILTVEVVAGIETFDTVDIVGFGISWVLTVLLVLSNIAFYRESGRLRDCAFACSIISMTYAVISFIYNTYWDGFISTHAMGNLILFIVLLIDAICIRYMSKQSVEVE